MNEHLKICHDRLLPHHLAQPQHTIQMGDGASRAIIVFKKLWVNGSTLHVRFLSGTAAQQAKAKEQAGWWTPHANLRFDFNNAPDAEIRIAFDPSDGAWSYIGTDCQSILRNRPCENDQEGSRRRRRTRKGGAPEGSSHALGVGSERMRRKGAAPGSTGNRGREPADYQLTVWSNSSRTSLCPTLRAAVRCKSSVLTICRTPAPVRRSPGQRPGFDPSRRCPTGAGNERVKQAAAARVPRGDAGSAAPVSAR